MVEEDVWIRSNTVVLPNVELGMRAVIGAGLVVNKNVLPYAAAGDVPAKQVGARA